MLFNDLIPPPNLLKKAAHGVLAPMNFMTDAKADHNKALLAFRAVCNDTNTLSTIYTCVLLIGLSTPDASRSDIRKSTASSNSNCTLDTLVSAWTPLPPSSLHRSSTLTLTSSCDMRIFALAIQCTRAELNPTPLVLVPSGVIRISNRSERLVITEHVHCYPDLLRGICFAGQLVLHTNYVRHSHFMLLLRIVLSKLCTLKPDLTDVLSAQSGVR
ncbi:hypothetical protein BD769DRAFT_1382597 [Suillus cothurnatus]|nr:hypothetical protein BD769DRAFT_1382597 [Suillus cothurnatus]